jgi:hypothetical protein
MLVRHFGIYLVISIPLEPVSHYYRLVSLFKPPSCVRGLDSRAILSGDKYIGTDVGDIASSLSQLSCSPRAKQ